MRWTVWAAALAALCLADASSGEEPRLVVRNHASGDVVRYPVVLLQGEVDAPENAEIVARNLDSERPTKSLTFHVRHGRFKALTELLPGENRVELACGGRRAALVLSYVRPTTRNVIRFSYVVGSDGDETYQSERDGDAQDFRGKLDTAAKLLQTFCAESLAAAGLPPRTFALELDAAGRVNVHVVRAPKTGDEYRAYADDQRLWRELGDVVRRALPPAPAKDVAVMAFSRFDPKTKKVRGHTALGGDDFALMGGAGLFAWPTTLGEVESAFLDAHLVDASRTFDDTVGRGTYWAVASTTLGAVMHEAGHALGLPHSVDPLDVMMPRSVGPCGFDKLNRAFTVVEPPTRAGRGETEFRDDDVPGWGAISGPRLAFSPFFLADPPTGEAVAAPTIRVEDGRVVVVAPGGLRALGIDSYESDGGVLARRTLTFGPGVVSKEFDVETLRRVAAGRPFGLVAFDDRGATARAAPGDLVDAADFLRTWRHLPETKPWPDRSRPPEGGDEALAAIERGRAEAPATSPGAYVDLLSVHGVAGGRTAWAWTEFSVAAAARLKLLVGSDDSVRAWIDGKRVVERIVERGASPDQDEAEVDLASGRHVLVVEVGNGVGAWGFFARLVDDEGRPWTVGADGVLSPR